MSGGLQVGIKPQRGELSGTDERWCEKNEKRKVNNEIKIRKLFPYEWNHVILLERPLVIKWPSKLRTLSLKLPLEMAAGAYRYPNE